MPILQSIEALLASANDGLTGVTHTLTDRGSFEMFNAPGLWNIAGTDQSYWLQNGQQGCFRGTFHEIVLPRIPAIIASTEKILDLNVLELPTGEFQQAIAEGLRRLQAKRLANRPVIRMIVGFTIGDVIKLHTISELQDWFNRTLAMAGITQQDFIADYYLAISFDHIRHWNHSKILAADDQGMFGGVNLWQDDYLRFAPVHDVGGFAAGPPVQAAHRFCSQLWNDTLFQRASCVNGVAGDAMPPPLQFPPTDTGDPINALALGRLADGDGDGSITLSNNASVTARIMAICQARTQVRMAQQTLGGGPHVEKFEDVLCALIAKSMIDGIDFDIVVSNDNTGDYDGAAQFAVSYLTSWVQHLLLQPDSVPDRANPQAWAGLTVRSFGLPYIDDPPLAQIMPQANDIVVRHLRLCRLAFSPDSIVRDAQGVATGAQWADGDKTMPARNHAKVYIVDEDCFYFGSDNAYRSGSAQGLIEFGYLIEDTGLLRRFTADYWQRLWENAQQCRVLLFPPPTPPLIA
jgi:phosphatidylserine/phosphatidylglycerophosphate/cardiolipin synthase-like enzyme